MDTYKIRVAMGTSYPYDENRVRGGVEAVALNLVTALAKRDDIELHIVSCNTTIKRSFTEKRGPITFHWLATMKRFWGIRALTIDAWRVKRVYKKLQPDIIHAQTWGEYALAIPKGIPGVITPHGFEAFNPVMLKTKHFRGITGFYRRLLINHLAKNSLAKTSVLISIAGDYVIEITRKFLSNQKTYNIPNPINNFWFQDNDNQSDEKIILCVGNISEVKNTLGLIKIFAKTIEQIPETRLELAGAAYDQDYFEQVKNEIRLSGLTANVCILGHLDQEKLLEAYKRASLVVLASIQETYPMALAQAMAMGKCVVATRVGGIPSLIQEGTTGYMVNVNEINAISKKIVDLLQDETERNRIGQAAQEWARNNLSADIVADKTMKVYCMNSFLRKVDKMEQETDLQTA
jgi:glycosyltransferase involved in cell wall biosynthesis